MRNVFSTCFAWFRRYHHPYRDVHILVIGIDNAGKSTTVASIQNDSTDGITPTIGFASSSLRMRRCDVTMLDVGGGSKIRGIWENYYAEVHGIVFVIDASDAQRIGEARDVLEEVVKDARMGGKPVLLLANKNDVDGAMDEIDVCNQLNVHELMEQQQFSCQVEQCVAVKRKCDRAIMRGMKWLLQIVCDNYNALAERVNADVAVQREEEARERRERAERVRILREERRQQEEAAGLKEEEEDEDNVEIQNPFVPVHKHIESVEQKENERENEGKRDKRKKETTTKADTEREGEETRDENMKRNTEQLERRVPSSSSDEVFIDAPKSLPDMSPSRAIATMSPVLNGTVQQREGASTTSLKTKKPKKKKKQRRNKVGVMPIEDDSSLPPIRGIARPVWIRAESSTVTDLPPSELQYSR